MEEKKTIKISITTFFLILTIVVIIAMGIFIAKISKQQEEQIELNNELKKEINELKTNSNNVSNELETNTINNTLVESSTREASFTDSEVKKSLEEYLNLIGYKHGYEPALLVPMNLVDEEYMANLEANSNSNENYVGTKVNYNKFKNEILNYISNDFFDKEFDNDYINRNGTLYVMDVDGSGDSYKVKSISKISDNSYKAEIENDAYEDVITETINFKITSNRDGKCVIDECDIK